MRGLVVSAFLAVVMLFAIEIDTPFWQIMNNVLINDSRAAPIVFIIPDQPQMPVAPNAYMVVPSWRVGASRVYVTRCTLVYAPGSFHIVNPMISDNVRIYVDGELVLTDKWGGHIDRGNIWNMDFIIGSGGRLELGRNNFIIGNIIIESGGVFALGEGLHIGDVIYRDNPTLFSMEVRDHFLNHSFDGQFAEGDMVHISRLAQRDDYIFYGWQTNVSNFTIERYGYYDLRYLYRFIMPPQDVQITAIWDSKPPYIPATPNNYRLFVASYLYDNFSNYARPLVIIDDTEQAVLYDDNGRPFVYITEDKSFWVHVNTPSMHQFLSWEDSPGINENYRHLQMGQTDLRLRINFEGIYVVLIDGVASGSIAGSLVLINTEQRQGYRFDGWSILSGNIAIADMQNTSTSFVMPRGAYPGQVLGEIVSSWERLPAPPPPVRNIVIIDGGDGYFGYGTFEIGQEVYVYAGVRPGYAFAGWFVDGEMISINALISFAMIDGDISLVAAWRFISVQQPQMPQPPTHYPNNISAQEQTATPVIRQSQIAATPAFPSIPSMAGRSAVIFTPTFESMISRAFDDVTKDAWYYDYINFVSRRGILPGISVFNFAPNSPISRDVFVAALLNIIEEEYLDELDLDFDEIKTRAQAARALTVLYKEL
ncbi:MAG: S-layer homology domain-containing protein [Defluviitaleaceae bacterium]|nr:S-layer homology domain-containing protein [Defluviitaleaceae bacterium]